jgi:hypothetical protein
MARDEDLDLIKAIRLCAFGAVKDKDTDYILRHIFRWYAREFRCTPDVASEKPLDEVLTHFFECRYEGMDDEELEEEAQKLRETKAERLEREAREKLDEEDDDEFFRETVAEAKTVNAKAKRAQLNLDGPIDDPDLERPVLLPVMGEKLPQTLQQFADKVDPKLKNVPQQVPPEIKMEFVSESELGDLDDWDILGPPSKDKL